MSLPAIPTKTALGQEALRRRTGDLGQRHRTILFLVDGRRPLSEVLSLAHQAGAATSHFEDLVRMGFVELPAEPAPVVAEPEPPELPPSAAQLTELEVQVPADEPPIEPEPPPAPPTATRAPQRTPEPPPLPRPPSPPPAVAVRRVVAMPPPEPARVEPPAAVAARFDPAAELPSRPFLPPSQTPPAVAPPPALPLEDQPVLEQARAHLIESLRCDPQPAAGRLSERVRAAQGSSELVDVVWTMERGLHHHQRSHRGLLALQRARELLGLGNTLVDEDSTPGRLEDEDW